MVVSAKTVGSAGVPQKAAGCSAMEALCRELAGCLDFDSIDWCASHGIRTLCTSLEEDKEHARADVERRIAEAREADGAAPACVRAPLDADGAPILPGDVVWANGTPGGDWARWRVLGVGSSDHPVIACGERGERRELRAGWLTHREPDSWRRLEREAAELDEAAGRPVGGGAADLVRRARELARKEASRRARD